MESFFVTFIYDEISLYDTRITSTVVLSEIHNHQCEK